MNAKYDVESSYPTIFLLLVRKFSGEEIFREKNAKAKTFSTKKSMNEELSSAENVPAKYVLSEDAWSKNEELSENQIHPYFFAWEKQKISAHLTTNV
jgi:hypothetical protein